jgi:hypothetical protein
VDAMLIADYIAISVLVAYMLLAAAKVTAVSGLKNV